MNDYETLQLASLLHDIGKFWQRSGQGPPAANFCAHQPRHNRFRDCPDLQRDYRYAHSLLTEAFFQDGDLVPETLARAGPHAAAHHRPAGQLSKIIALADRLSSGERTESDEEFPAQLKSVLSSVDIGLGNSGGARRDAWLPLKPFALTREALFPSEKPLSDEEIKASYARLWEGFAEQVRLLPAVFEVYFTGVLDLLRQYGSCIPSSAYKAQPDISLFDHSSTTCAIAACLYLSGLPEADLDRLLAPGATSSPGPDRPFLLVGGDLSGIQAYLFQAATVGAGGAARGLRARSFFLASLMEATSHRLLHTLVPGERLPSACCVIKSGGKFVILAPNTPAVRENLDSIGADINRWLLRSFQGDLALALAALPLGVSDFSVAPGSGRRNISGRLDDLEDRLAAAKAERLRPALASAASWSTESFLGSGDFPHGVCEACERNPASGSPVEGERLCSGCRLYQDIGRALVRATFISYSEGAGAGPGSIPYFVDGSYYATVAQRAEQVPAGAYVVEALVVPEDGRPGKSSGRHREETGAPGNAPIVQRMLANHVPYFRTRQEFEDLCDRCGDQRCNYRDEAIGRDFEAGAVPYSFGCMAAACDGEKLLGVLKGDVDRLGFIFSMGMGESASLSRIATLSRLMETFFSGWIERTLGQEEFRLTYTVYSGGDDFLLVGPWDMTISLAQRLEEDFRAYVSGNPNITLSAGIAVIKPHFPVARAAPLADSHLEEAKDAGRSRLRLFGTTVLWQDLPGLMDWAVYLQGLVSRDERGQDRVSKAFLYRLLEYSERARNWHDAGPEAGAEGLTYMSHLAYDLRRNFGKEEASGRDRFREERERLSQLMLKENNCKMAAMRLPITWALLKERRT